MATKKVKETLVLNEVTPRMMEVRIVGTSDLYLNKMNSVTVRSLTDERKDKAKSTEKPNMWEQIMTSIHWEKGTPTDFSEEGFTEALANNRPCITAFGLKKSFGDAVVRNNIDTYATKFHAGVNIMGSGLVPIEFAEHFIDEKLMSPKKGSPVLARLNRFSGWSATFNVSYLENVYSAEQIVNIIELAGFGGGIGSGRSSGYGRYKVDNVKPL
jgi:hypothetical protein